MATKKPRAGRKPIWPTSPGGQPIWPSAPKKARAKNPAKAAAGQKTARGFMKGKQPIFKKGRPPMHKM